MNSLPAGAGDDHVFEEAQAEGVGCLDNASSGRCVGGAGRRIAARVVVGEAECLAVAAEHGHEYLAHRQERAVCGALADGLDGEHAVGVVADHHEHPLPAESSESRCDESSEVCGAVDHRG